MEKIKVGLRGIFKFSAPYDTTVNSKMMYTMISRRSIEELVTNNELPLKTIYEPVGLTAEDMRNDMNNNVNILVFRNDACMYLYIPENRVDINVTVTGTLYENKIGVMNLGSLPLDFNLDNMITDVNDVVLTHTGIKTSLAVVSNSSSTLVDKTTHDANMLILDTRKENSTSLTTKLAIANAEIVRLNNKIDKLITCYTDKL